MWQIYWYVCVFVEYVDVNTRKVFFLFVFLLRVYQGFIVHYQGPFIVLLGVIRSVWVLVLNCGSYHCTKKGFPIKDQKVKGHFTQITKV